MPRGRRLFAVLDANVLIPALKGDFLLTAAFLRLYTPVLSERIFAECRRNLDAGKTGRLDAAEDFFADRFVTGWESREDEMPLSRCPEDRHVLALAVFSESEILVTDERGLVEEINSLDLGVLALTADGFACELLELRGAEAVGAVITTMAEKRRRPPKSEAEVWSVLSDPVSGMPRLAERYRHRESGRRD